MPATSLAPKTIPSHQFRWAGLWAHRTTSLATVAILASVAATLAFVWIRCPFDLAPDEAHYWDWSRHLDWSYYSKGPLVA
jgi:hypothetical protein